MSSRPYELVQGKPNLAESVVLFIDILGSRELARSDKAQNNLERLFSALQSATHYTLDRDQGMPYRLATFTDNIALGWPLSGWDEEPAIGSVLFDAAYFQFELAQQGLFARGAITKGLGFFGDRFAFGPALVEAYDLERKVAVQPRVVLSAEVVRAALSHTKYHGGVSRSPQNLHILLSGDVNAFVNYLAVVFEEEDDQLAYEALVQHRDQVLRALSQFHENVRVWEKYRWVADYHNHFCRNEYPEHPDLLIPPGRTVTPFLTLAEAFESDQGNA